jgi:hypothetical protein
MIITINTQKNLDMSPWQKRGRGMKDRVDKSMGIVTLIVESLDNIKSTETLRLVKKAAHRKRTWSDSETDSETDQS